MTDSYSMRDEERHGVHGVISRSAALLRRQVLSRANLEAAAVTQVKGKVENILEQKGRVRPPWLRPKTHIAKQLVFPEEQGASLRFLRLNFVL